MPQFDGLFDYQNNVRPTYFTFKLLSRLQGDRLPLSSSHPAVHGFAAHDEQMRMDNVVLWNFSTNLVPVELSLLGLTRDMRTRHIVLDAQTASNDENARLRPEPFATLPKGNHLLELKFEPYAVHYWSFE
jgi:xylan 1,4-beta-xylosidase